MGESVASRLVLLSVAGKENTFLPFCTFSLTLRIKVYFTK